MIDDQGARRRRIMFFGCIIAATLAFYVGTEFHDAVAQAFHLEP